MGSKRQDIVDAIVTRLQGIGVGNVVTVGGDSYTCQTDVGGRVESWRAEPYGENDLPAINVRDMLDPLEEEGVVGKTDHALRLEIACLVKGGTSVSEARNALRDMLRVLGSDETFGGLAYRSRPGVAEFAVEQASERLVGFTLDLLVAYRTARWDI